MQARDFSRGLLTDCIYRKLRRTVGTESGIGLQVVFVLTGLLKIFRGFTTFNSRYTNNMPEFFATNLHFPAAIEFALVSLYVLLSHLWNPLFLALYELAFRQGIYFPDSCDSCFCMLDGALLL